ncbi:MAG: aldehyde:ferredoxin oxidoreductase [Chloroflexota bacterium]|nr:aldehyde:ferredoxin oxidoreductase [Chloroflexota bacterium]
MSVGATWGKILHVDLTTSKIWTENPPDELYLKLVGGRALEAYLLLRDLPVGVDPLGPDNLLIFAAGIFQGTNLPGAGRHSVGGKSPLTGAIGSAEAGGWWGHEFKRSGWDALVVHGQATSPVYLWIRDDKVEIRPADHLWGREVAEVENAIRDELQEPKLRVAQCGIAGENLVLVANVINDYNRAAGRNGLGAVMGSKKLKAVAVRGAKNVPLTDRKPTTALSKWLGDNYKTLAAWAHEKGTPGGLTGLNRASALPTRNFQDPGFPDAESIGWETLHTSILIGRDTCQACPIECKQVVSYEGQDYPDSPAFKTQVKGEVTLNKVYGGPEYETLGSFGSSCGVNDIVAVSKANEWTAAWGLDPISTGMTVAFVMECVERGLLTAEMTGGFLPKWGNAKDMLEAVDMLAHRRGFGDIMALGSKRIAAWIGKNAADYLVEVKGQELPMHEPRLKAALGVGYSVAPVGADHMMNIHDTGYAAPGGGLDRVNAVYKVGPLPPSELSTEKMTLFYYEANWQHFQDCAISCMFYPYNYIQLAGALSAMTGHEYSAQDILDVGERAQQLSRLFNLREGFTEKDDRLPKRVMQAFKSGPLEGIEITEEALHTSRQTWYGLMGWTPEGVPTQERLAKLGLTELLETK